MHSAIVVTEHPDPAVVRPIDPVRCRSLRESARDEVLGCLALPHKRLPSRLLYDEEGRVRLARLVASPAFYPARAERELMDAHGAVIALQLGPGARVVEPWSGDLERTLRLLRGLDRPARYVPVDVDPVRRAQAVAAVRAALPSLEVSPAAALDELPGDEPRSLVYLPGTALGCVEPSEAVALLRRLAHAARRGGMLVFGADATSDPAALARAYDDPDGAAAAWARHALEQVNRTHEATFDPDAFAYDVAWNPVVIRLELRLVSRRAQHVRVAGETIALAAGEPIDVEHRYQHTSEVLQAMIGIAGWWSKRVFTAGPEPMRLWTCERLLRIDRRRRTGSWWHG